MKTEGTGSDKNLLLITMDSVRHDYLGCYSGLKSNTGNIDSLASRSCVFDQAITNGSYTKTAFPPILSSTYSSSYSGPFKDVGKERPMLASVLKNQGFATAGFTANPLLGSHIGYDAGFDVFAEPTPPPESRKWLRLRGAQRVLRSPLLNSVLRRAGIDTMPHPVYVDGQTITDGALGWLEGQKDRFFLWVHYMDAHWPYHQPSSLACGSSCAQAWKDLQVMHRNRKSYPGSEMVSRIQSLYRAGIEKMDREIGRLLRRLETSGLASRTVVAVTSDHGEAFYEHGRWQHGAYVDFHEEILRVPLIIHVPGSVPPQRVSEQVTLLDLAPTLVEALDLRPDSRMAGRSLYPAVVGHGAVDPGFAVTEMIGHESWSVSMRTPDYKFIYDEQKPDSTVFYDLRNDPGETVNCWGRYPDIQSAFQREMTMHLDFVRRSSGTDPGHWQTSPEVMQRLRALGYVE